MTVSVTDTAMSVVDTVVRGALTFAVQTGTRIPMRTLFLSAIAVVAFTVTPPVLHGAEDAPKVAVVHFSKLTPFLSDVAGWEAGKAEGQTIDTGGFKMSNVERRYRMGDASVHVTIMDYSESAPMLNAMTAMWSFSSETTEGYQKGVALDGMKGMEDYKNAEKQGHLFLLVAGRYIVQLETRGLPAGELQAWAKKLDLKRLAELK